MPGGINRVLIPSLKLRKGMRESLAGIVRRVVFEHDALMLKFINTCQNPFNELMLQLKEEKISSHLHIKKKVYKEKQAQVKVRLTIPDCLFHCLTSS